MKKFLAETNPYLKNRKFREEMILRQSIDSNAFEGVHGLGQRLNPSRIAKEIDSAKKPSSAS